MKQPHTETGIDHTDGEQDTGNHRTPDAGAPVPGGTRIGAENVEPTNTEYPASTAEDAELDNLDDSLSVNGPTERDVERDERGRL